MKIKLLGCTFFLVCHALAKDPVMERVVSRFAFSNWCGRVKQNYSPVDTSWTLPVLDLNRSTNTISVFVHEKKRDSRNELTVFDAVKGEMVLQVKCYIATNIVEAHGMMMWSFATTTSTRDYSACTNSYGDRGYDLLNGVKFVRNNVYVSIISCTNSLSSSVVEQIDANILAHSSPGTISPPDTPKN